MKEKKGLFVFSLVLSLVALGVFAAVAIVGAAGLANKVSPTDMLFKSEAYLNLVKSFNFSDTSLPVLLSVIGSGLIEAFFVAGIILVIVKRRPIFLIPVFLFEVAGTFCCIYLNAGGRSLFAANDSLLFQILCYAGVGISAVAGLVTIIALARTHRPVPEWGESRVQTVVVPENSASEEAPVENPAPIEYVEPHAPLSYAEEEDEDPIAATTDDYKSPDTSTKTQKILGKYEIYPEAGFFKYRLKANNGEILLVSHGYTTRDGVRSGILTLQRNVPNGISKIITDKNGYSQFRIFTQNDSRLVAAGEFYASSAAAQKALSSVQRFYLTERIVDLNEIPETEVREWKIDLPPMNPSKNGKFEVYIEEEHKKWQGRLVANNGAVLFVTSTYSSRNAVLKAFGSIKGKILSGDIDIARDKQNRYHFRVISENGSVILMGETYPSRDSAISAASSVRNFIADAKVVDLSRGS